MYSNLIYILNGVSIFVLFVLFNSCRYDKECLIPIRIDEESQRIFLPVTFNGETSEFLFDTGGTLSTIKEYNCKDTEKKNIIEVFKFDSDTFAHYYPKGNFEIGLFKVDASFIVQKKNNNVLGMNIISNYYWYFDLEKSIVHISKSPITGLGKEVFGFDYTLSDKGTIKVKIPTSSRKELTLLFDTGAGIEASLFLFHKGDSVPLDKWSDCNSDFIYQRNSDNFVWISGDLPVNGYTMDHVLFIFDSDSSRIRRFNENGFDGLISMSFVRRYQQFYIDPKAKKILFYGKNPERQKELKNYFDHIKGVVEAARPQKNN